MDDLKAYSPWKNIKIPAKSANGHVGGARAKITLRVHICHNAVHHDSYSYSEPTTQTWMEALIRDARI